MHDSLLFLYHLYLFYYFLTEPKAVVQTPMLFGRVFFPLKPVRENNQVSELTSLLQMKCIRGQHQIKTIKLLFDKPTNSKNMIESLTIKVHVHPSGFKTQEVLSMINSEIVHVELKQPVNIRLGDLIDIEAEAKNVRFQRFLQFNDVCHVPSNPHFQCCIASRPKVAKLYFISDVEYGPQPQSKVAKRVTKLKNKAQPGNK